MVAALTVAVASGCGAQVSVEGAAGSGGAVAGEGGAMAAVGGAAGGGAAAMGGGEPATCTLGLTGEPSLPFPDDLNYTRPNMAVRQTPAGSEMLLHMWQWENHVVATLELGDDGAGDLLVEPVATVDGATNAGVIGATSTPGTQAALFPIYPPHSLAMQRVSFDGTTGPVVPLALDVGPVVIGGHLALADAPGGAEHLVTYNHFGPVENGPHLEPRVALLDATAQLTHGPVALETPPDHEGLGVSLSSIWVDDHALTAVARSACWAPADCEPAVAVHRVTVEGDDQLDATMVWTHEAPNNTEAALAMHDGRVWLALYDGQNEVAELRLWELTPDGAVIRGPVTIDTAQTPGSPAKVPLGYGGPGLQLVATPWGLVASAQKLTPQSPPSGAQVVAELGVIHLSFDLDVLSPPTTITFADPEQQSAPRLAATPDGAVAVWRARGLVGEAPFGANDGWRIYLAHFRCEM
jgi:hypothetical protein